MWRLLVVLTAILVFASGNNLEIRKPLREGRIVGGEAIQKSDVPYQVLVRFNNKRSCGGSILNSRTILTAAHCIIVSGRAAAYFYSIQYGTAEIVGNQNIINATRALRHKYFNPFTLDYDIGLIFLSAEIPFDQNSQPIRLALEEPKPGTPAFISGWGRLAENGNSTTNLRRVGVEIINRTTCTEIYKSYKYKMTDRMICDGMPDGGKASCAGDSGGPVVIIRNSIPELVGVVSWSEGCGRKGHPGVKANVAYLRDWIVEKLRLA